MKDYSILDELVPKTQELHRAIFDKGYEQGKKSRKGKWLRMSDLSEKLDDRYKCSYCGNVVHYKNKMNLYTFNRWCGRCGSDNGRKIDETKQELAYADQEAMMPATNLIQGKRAGIFEFAFDEDIKDYDSSQKAR